MDKPTAIVTRSRINHRSGPVGQTWLYTVDFGQSCDWLAGHQTASFTSKSQYVAACRRHGFTPVEQFGA